MAKMILSVAALPFLAADMVLMLERLVKTRPLPALTARVLNTVTDSGVRVLYYGVSSAETLCVTLHPRKGKTLAILPRRL